MPVRERLRPGRRPGGRRRPEQGWSLLCNGVVVFDDAGALLPDGHTVAGHALMLSAAA